jgi:hypothetical protein
MAAATITTKSITTARKEAMAAIIQGVRIDKRTSRERVSAILETRSRKDARLDMVLYALKWAVVTGRATAEQEKFLKELSGKEFAGFIASIYANKSLATIEDVKNFFIGKRAA